MTAGYIVRSLGLAILLSAAAFQAAAKENAEPYEPKVGQPGKDVVWIPTSQTVAGKMLDMAKVTPKDYVIDLGSGDGRTVITAAKRGAKALGIEYNPDLVALSKRNAEQEGVAGRARFVKADIFESDFSQATVITLFLLPDLNLKLRPKILGLKPGTRIVSNTFDMGDWEADETAVIDQSGGCENSWCTALLWIVPARVAGTHHVKQGELVLKQKYQMLTGTLRSNGQTIPVKGKVNGNKLELNTGAHKFQGKVVGKRIELD